MQKIKNNYEYLARIILIPLFLFPIFSFSQSDSIFIEGKIIDARTKAVMPYAHIYHSQSLIGTISNTQGYFKLKINSFTDSIVCSFIGYQKQILKLNPNIKFYTIELLESVNELGEVIVTAGDDSYLFDLVNTAKKTVTQEIHTGKAYFDLKSFVNERQIEQVEGFYNVDVKNYDPIKMRIKTGRIALKEYNKRLFTSLESSRVFTMQKLFEKNDYFPLSPVELSTKKARKYFSAYLSHKYINDEKDSIYVIQFIPKVDSTRNFRTTVWFNPLSKHIIKIKYDIKKSAIHPFYPLFHNDSIKSVDISITKTFTKLQKHPVIDHIDFSYTVQYKSRSDTLYTVKTDAVLHIYDFVQRFELPHFSFSDENISDYRKINAIPHNDYFWMNNSEMKLNDQYNRNNEFYNNPFSVTNKKIFSANKYGPFGLMEYPYIQWTGKRILFKEKLEEAKTVDLKNAKLSAKAQYYDLSVKIFLDMFEYGESIQIISKTIFDPYESYFQLEMNRATQCFINIYFDLIECERIKLMEKIAKSDKKRTTIKTLYDESVSDIYYMKQKYFKETERGTKLNKLEDWNNIVKEKLKIDNIELFQIQDE